MLVEIAALENVDTVSKDCGGWWQLPVLEKGRRRIHVVCDQKQKSQIMAKRRAETWVCKNGTTTRREVVCKDDVTLPVGFETPEKNF